MGSSQINLSGFNVGESNVRASNRLCGDVKIFVLKQYKEEKTARDERLRKHFESNR